MKLIQKLPKLRGNPGGFHRFHGGECRRPGYSIRQAGGELGDPFVGSSAYVEVFDPSLSEHPGALKGIEVPEWAGPLFPGT